MFGENPIQHITEYHSPYFQEYWWLRHFIIVKDWGVFQDKKMNIMELSTGKILDENLIHSASHQTLGDGFTFQQDNSLKNKAKSTLEFLTKKTVSVPAWQSSSFDLNLLENQWQDLDGCLAMINQFDILKIIGQYCTT